LLGAARHADHFAFQQRGDDAIHRDAAHRLDLRAANRLAVRDDGQCFQRGLAEPRRFGLIEKPVRPDRELGPSLEDVPARDSLHHEARSIGGELRVQLLDGGVELGGSGLFIRARFRRGGKLRRLMQRVRDGFRGQGPIRGEKQRFDDAGQIHPIIFWKTATKGKR